MEPDHSMASTDWRSATAELRRNWKALLGACIGMAVGAAAYPTFLIPVITLRLQDAFGWTPFQTSSLSSLALLGGALGAPVAGRVIDRFSTRKPALISTLAICALLVAAAFLDGRILLWQIGAFLIPFLGSATLSHAYSKLICSLFMSTRGLALGVVLGCGSLAGAIGLPLLDGLFVRFDIRSALLIIGAAYLLLFVPLLWMLLPRRQAIADAGVAAIEAVTTGSNRAALLILSAAALAITMALAGSASQLPHLMRATGGLSPVAAGSLLALGVLIARPLSGLLVDRLLPWAVTATVFSASALGLLLLAFDGRTFAIAGTLLIAAGLGAEFDLIAFLVARYVNPARFGTTFGWIYAGMLLLGAAGPVFFAYLRPQTGGFSFGFAVAAAISFLAAGLICLLAFLPPRTGVSVLSGKRKPPSTRSAMVRIGPP